MGKRINSQNGIRKGVFVLILLASLSVPLCVKGEYKYPISTRFKPLNKRMEAALDSGKTVRVKTSLSMPECQYYLDSLIYNATDLRYATYHAYKVLKETDAIRLKRGSTYCVFVVKGADLAPLMAECRDNQGLVKKALRKIGITKKTKVKKAIGEIVDYIYYRNPQGDAERFANPLLHGSNGNCAAMSSAFKAFMIRLDIPCEFIIGYVGDECHAWNRVKISGKWYYLDIALSRGLKRKLWKGYRNIIERF